MNAARPFRPLQGERPAGESPMRRPGRVTRYGPRVHSDTTTPVEPADHHRPVPRTRPDGDRSRDLRLLGPVARQREGRRRGPNGRTPAGPTRLLSRRRPWVRCGSQARTRPRGGSLRCTPLEVRKENVSVSLRHRQTRHQPKILAPPQFLRTDCERSHPPLQECPVISGTEVTWSNGPPAQSPRFATYGSDGREAREHPAAYP